MNIVFFGPPGAGKGTVAGILSEQTGIPHISTGDLFREAIENETELGKRVKALTEAGSLVPDDLTIALVHERMQRPDVKRGALLDGFPRTVPQADSLDEIAPIEAVVNLRADEELIIRRLSGRRVCHDCDHIHHIEFRPPKVEGVCDKCGGGLYQRKDDTVEAIRHRLDVYREQTESLIGYYRARDLIVDIDGNGQAEDVCSDVVAALDISLG